METALDDDADPFAFVIDILEARVMFTCGFTVPIVAWFDDEGELTDMIDEICFIAVRLPEIGVVPIALDDDDDLVFDEQLH